MIHLDYINRIHQVLDLSWNIFKSQYLYGRITAEKEAPFQHHFSSIIKEIRRNFCVKRKEIFFTDLETRLDIEEKRNYIDITCGYLFEDIEVKVAIELKFKTKKQSAYDWGRIDSYVDLGKIEKFQKNGYDYGYFYLVTDAPAYSKKNTRGAGVHFPMYDGYVAKPGVYNYQGSKGREHVYVDLEDSYQFDWDTKLNVNNEKIFFLNVHKIL